MSVEIMGPLLGVVVGGVIATGGTVWVERKRDERDERRERRADERLVRQATRMIHQELLTIQIDLDAAIENNVWWKRTDLCFETPGWERFAAVLAASEIDDNSWIWVAHAYNEITDLNVLVKQAVTKAKNAGIYQVAFNDSVSELAQTTRTSVEQGVEFIEAFMRDEPSPAETGAASSEGSRPGSRLRRAA